LGNVGTGQAGNSKKEAEKTAMRLCGKSSKTGGCRLLSGGIYAGSIYGSELEKNRQAFSMSAEQLLALSQERSEKKYLSTVATESNLTNMAAASKAANSQSANGGWGALAVSGQNSNGVYNRPSKEDAERQVLAQCEGCTVIAAFDKTKTEDVIELDADPAVAGGKANSRCTQKYGECTTQVRCSGAQYPASNPYAR
jgi:hypothetical protein